ncbi:glycosyltransferase family 2 protein [Streptomyces sp. NPDC060194]|uniref:glycosyltransferase family 2 protein n=1 Tax=Streptomyces sp. NPDC060194 TaxID=3347069 RepID=UPI003661AB24
MKVTVIIPTHNTGDGVLPGLDSLRNQTMPRSDFEVVYVDDGSTDDTVALLTAELADEPNMQLVAMSNSGWPGRPRNTGVERARGEYVHFVDDDDWLAPQALERLYARAEETGADIVAGRMAGHGRGAPRAPFARKLAPGSLRENPVLLGSMTVHKLFRRQFLLDHRLRFEEGRVRLEDHMFMLRAYLLAQQVSTVADYTTYHWVRHRNGKHNISYSPIEPGPYIDSVRRIIALLHAPDTYVADDDLRHRFIANWYGSKALKRLTGKGFLAQDEERRAAWRRAVVDLAAELPPKADRHLPARLAVLSRLCRAGDHDAIEAYARFEAEVRQQPRVEEAVVKGGRIHLHTRTTLVHTDAGTGETVPLLFSRTVRETASGAKAVRWHWRLPAPLGTLPLDAEPDLTEPLTGARAQAMVHHESGGTQLVVTTGTSELVPVADPADPDLWQMHWMTRCTVDPAGVDALSGPLEPGTWHLRLRLNMGGWLSAPRLPRLKLAVAATSPGGPKPAAPAPARPTAFTNCPAHRVVRALVPTLRLLLPAGGYTALRSRYHRSLLRATAPRARTAASPSPRRTSPTPQPPSAPPTPRPTNLPLTTPPPTPAPRSDTPSPTR